SCDQIRAIVKRHDGDAFRQAFLQVFDLLFYTIDDFLCVFSETDYYHSADCSDSFFVERAASKIGADGDCGYIANIDRYVVGCGYNDIFDIRCILNETETAYDVIFAPVFDYLAAYVVV